MNIVCFTNVASALLIIEIIRTYGFSLVAKFLFKEKIKDVSLIVLSAINLCLHLALFVVLMIIGAPYEEMLMLCLGSAALALTVARIDRRAK